MGTRADFYVGRGEHAEWLGSIAWDGYPDGIDMAVKKATSEADYRAALETFLASREDTTRPEHGRPWPWDTSHTTDYAYAFDGGEVFGSCFGHKWFPVDSEDQDDESTEKVAVFPNMKDRQNVTFGKRSGVMVFRVGGQ